MPTRFDLAYLVAAPVLAPLQVLKLLRSRRPVRPLWERLRGPFLASGKKPRIWVHAVSMGEVSAGRPLVRLLAAANPNCEVVVSASTETGREHAARLFGMERTFPCPLDFSWTVARAFDSVNPALVVLLELEIWPNLVGEAARRKIPVAVVNGRITDRSAQGYLRVKNLLAPTFRQISLYAVQTEAYAQRFAAIGAPRERIVVTGSMKYDCSVVVGNPEKRELMRRRLLLQPDALVLVAGSTHPGEEQAVVEAAARVSTRFPSLRLVLVPRHVNRVNQLVKDLAAWGFSAVRKTAIDAAGITCRAPIGPRELLLVDTTGQLGDVYHAADVVFVGGSLIPHGGQNVIEPAGLGLPVLWGPHTFNFDDAVARIAAAGGGRMVSDGETLARAVEELLADPRRRQMMGAAAQESVAHAQGAAEKTADMLKKLLSGSPPV